LDNAKIIATDQKTGAVSSTLSDAQGGYAISLKPNAAYLLRFSKPGFQDVTLNVKTTANDNRVLRNVDLLPVGTSGKITTASEPMARTETAAQPAADRKISPNTNPSAAEVPTSASTEKNLVSGYSIQVAAVKGQFGDISKFKDKLSDLGTVYTVNEDGRSKIRVGIVNDRADAEALQKLVRAKGFDGAFIVSEAKREMPGTAKPKTTNPTATTSYEKEIGSVADLKGTMIRLATYSNINYFDKGMVDDLGILTYVPKGKFTIVLLRGYNTTDDALIALRKAKVRGFPEAHLVDFQNGEMTKVK
jgi:hypothetical protein